VVHTFSKGFSALNMSPSNLSKEGRNKVPVNSGGSPIRTKPLNPTHNVKRGDSSCFRDNDRQNSFILKGAMHKARKNPKYHQNTPPAIDVLLCRKTQPDPASTLNSQQKTTRCSCVVFLVGVRLQSRGQTSRNT